jgi:cytochrome c peroxidase
VRSARAAAVILLSAAGAAAPSPRTDPPRSESAERALARLRRPPLGLPPLAGAEAVTASQIALGRKLFLDARLSVNGTMSCANCHVPEQGFTSHELSTAVGLNGASLPRNAPTLLNAAYAAPFFHDGREPNLDLQPFDVFLNPKEMGFASLGAVLERVRSIPEYEHGFRGAFGGPPSVERIGAALGAYIRTLLAANSPFDRWHFGGEVASVRDEVRRGFALFVGTAGCSGCHRIEARSALFTDHEFHDTGIGAARAEREKSPEPVPVELEPGLVARLDRGVLRSVGDPPPLDLGRISATGDPADLYAYKTPILRNVATTAPYMHDGSLSTLREVVVYYSRGGYPHPGLDPRIRRLDLTDREIDDMVAFLESLTGDNVGEIARDARRP